MALPTCGVPTEVNPNYALALIALAFAEATTGLAQEAEAHAQLALRLSPRDYWIGTAHLALAMAHFTLRNYDEAVRWCESAIQVTHRAPIRRALMIACSARAGDMARARSEIAVLDSFAPDFIASLFRGQNPVFTRKEDMEHLLDGLRLAGLQGDRPPSSRILIADFRCWHQTDIADVSVNVGFGGKSGHRTFAA